MDQSGSAGASRSERQAYYLAAAAWQTETSGASAREAKTAWRLAVVAAVVAVLNGVALAWLQPLRATVAYAIPTDSQRGSVLAAYPLAPGTLQSEPAMIQSMAARYVVAREGFDATRLSETFRRVELMSDSIERAAYAALLKPTSGQSPLATYPPRLTSTSTCLTGSTPSCLGTSDERVTWITYGANLLASSVRVVAGDSSVSATTGFTWAPAGDLTLVDVPLAGTVDVTQYRYGGAHQLLGVVGPNPGANGLRNRAQRYTYDGAGRRTLTDYGAGNSQSDADWANFVTFQQASTANR